MKEKGRAGAGRGERGGDSRCPGEALRAGPALEVRRLAVAAAAASASAASAGRHHEPGPAEGAGRRQLQPGAAHACPGRQPREHPAPSRDRSLLALGMFQKQTYFCDTCEEFRKQFNNFT